MRKTIIIVCLAIPLAACGGKLDPIGGDISGGISLPWKSDPSKPAGPTSVQRKAVYTAEQTLIGIGHLAVSYANLPLCPQPFNICRTADITKRISLAYDEANALMDCAENALLSIVSPKCPVGTPGDLGSVITLAMQATTSFQKILLDNNVSGLAGGTPPSPTTLFPKTP